jgi:4-amino-4-deoxy-L-arabinose transferase-like glycosyltransferase
MSSSSIDKLRLSLTYFVAALIFSGYMGLAVGSVIDKSPTFDESQYIARGWAAWRTGQFMTLGHPPLTNLLSGLGVLLEPGLPNPSSLPGWAQNDAAMVGDQLLWRNGFNASRIVFLARFPILLLGVLFVALIFRWARETYGLWSGLIALCLMSFSPTIIANAQLATTDIGVAAFYVASLYAWSRFLRRQTMRWLLISGVVLGLAQAAKFSALFLFPTLGLYTLWFALRHGPIILKSGGQKLVGWPVWKGPVGAVGMVLAAFIMATLVALLVLWACMFFTLDPLAKGSYLAELQHFISLAGSGHRAYLLGQYSDFGWWWYHPYVLVVKSTLPELLLLSLAIIFTVMRGTRETEWDFLFPALVYLVISLVTTLNVGVRYLLPAIPLLFIFASRVGAAQLPTFSWRRMILVSLIASWQIPVALGIYPNYLAFFNRLAGGPENGYRLLADSNLDWGQDLPTLASYVRDHRLSEIYLSYFGNADPAYYDIPYEPLPGWPPPSPKPQFAPLNPRPGIYAISASNLVGLPPWPFDTRTFDPDTFTYFRTRKPIAAVGYSILIFEVPQPSIKSGDWLAQCASPDPVEQEEQLSTLAGVPGLDQFYFDCRQSLPARSGSGWLVYPPDIDPIVDLGMPDYISHFPDGQVRYRVWHVEELPPPLASTIAFPEVALPLPIADHVDLLGYRVLNSQVRPGDTLYIQEWWRVRNPPPPPVSMFAHLITVDTSGLERTVAVGDALGVRVEDWRPSMVIIQQHGIPIAADTLAGDYWISLGLYSLQTNSPFPVTQTSDRVIDRIILQAVQVLSGSR